MHWFKAHNEALSDPKIAWVARQAKVSLPEAFGWWMSILSIASASPERGKLMLTETEPYTAEDIACNVTCNVSVTLAMLHTFQRAGLLALNEDVYEVVNWAKRQGNAKPGAQRTRECRERKQAVGVTLLKRYCNGIELELEQDITMCETSHSLLAVEETPPQTKRVEYPPDFEQVWKAYPRDEGKKQSLIEWKKLKATGVLPAPASLVDDIERLTHSEDWQRGAIPHFERFLKHERWNDGKEKKHTTGNNGNGKSQAALLIAFQQAGLVPVTYRADTVYIPATDKAYYDNGDSEQREELIESVRKHTPERIIAK